MSDTSAIDDKTTTDTSENDSDWGTFASLVFRYFILCISIVFIGINYIFLINYKQLDILFPTDMNGYIPTNSVQKGGLACKDCPFRDVSGKPPFDILQSYSMKGLPYSLYKSQSNMSYMQYIKNWFALTEANSFITFRTIMKKILQLDGIQTLPQPIQILLGCVLLIVGSICIPIISFFSSLMYIFSVNEYAWILGVVGILFGYTWIISFVNAWYHLFTFLLNLLIIPILLDSSLIGKLLQCNLSIFSNLFTTFVVIASWQSLNTTTSVMITIAYVVMLIKSYIS